MIPVKSHNGTKTKYLFYIEEQYIPDLICILEGSYDSRWHTTILRCQVMAIHEDEIGPIMSWYEDFQLRQIMKEELK